MKTITGCADCVRDTICSGSRVVRTQQTLPFDAAVMWRWELGSASSQVADLQPQRCAHV